MTPADPTVDKVSEIERKLSGALAARPEIQEAYLFGSRATGRAQAHSDIDVAIHVDTSALVEQSGYGYAADITAYLMSALGENDVDVAILNLAPPLLYHRVLRDGRRVFARDLRAATTREGYALSRYCDYLPQLEKIAAVRDRAAAGMIR